MKVAVMIPIVGNERNIPSILEIFRTKICPKLRSLGMTKESIQFTGMDYTFVPLNKSLDGLSKGDSIISCIKNLAETPDIVVSCDGSNKIPYKYVIDIFKELISDSSICCVMANRGDNKAIGDFRYLVERFEVFVLKNYHNHDQDILDGQCGLWGYRYGKIKINDAEEEIKLTSKRYEIELDLLGEVLEKKLNYSFVNVELPKKLEGVKSSYKFEDDLKKMSFLIKKYNKLKDCIPEYLKEFEKTREFSELIKKNDLREHWERYKRGLSEIVKAKS